MLTGKRIKAPQFNFELEAAMFCKWKRRYQCQVEFLLSRQCVVKHLNRCLFSYASSVLKFFSNSYTHFRDTRWKVWRQKVSMPRLVVMVFLLLFFFCFFVYLLLSEGVSHPAPKTNHAKKQKNNLLHHSSSVITATPMLRFIWLHRLDSPHSSYPTKNVTFQLVMSFVST